MPTQVRIQLGASSVKNNAMPNPIGTASNDAAQADLGAIGVDYQDDASLAATAAGRPTGGQLEAQAGTLALPTATLASGLPGATNFVPNNYDGDRVARIAPRYFDVTLGAAGTTTLNSTVVIDRFSISNAGAMLDVQAPGSLTSLISITQMTGTVQVNGALISPGDYMMLTGGLNGTGVVTTPFFTSIAGTISPGTVGMAGNIGTLTFRGNTIFASGTTYMIDLGNAGINDRIAVQTNAPGSGMANVGGRLVFSVLGGSMPRAGDRYTILTAQNGVTGTFIAPGPISAVLTPQVSYQPNAVVITLAAGTYASVVDPTSAVQTSYASLMDVNRGGFSGPLAGLYGPLDLLSVSGVRAFFESAAPRTETLRTATSVAATGTTDRFFRQRVHSIQPGESTGQLAISGNPLSLAGKGSNVRTAAPITAGLGLMDETRPGGTLPDDTSGYLVGGYLNGSSAPMPAAASGSRDTFDGWFMAVGFEKAVTNNATLGFGLSYADVDGTTGGAPQQAGSRLLQGTLYFAAASDKGLRFDWRLSAGLLSTDSRRTVTLASTPYTLTMDDDTLAISSEAGIGFDLAKGGNFSIVPRVSVRYENIAFDNAAEVGGPMALLIYRNQYKALEGRAGISFGAKPGMKVRPYLEVNYVHDFLDQPLIYNASFVGAAALAPFTLAGNDNDWAEISGGLTFDLGAKAQFSIEADTTVMRSDFRSQSYRGKLTLKF